MTEFALGLRLALSGGRGRAALVVFSNLLGVVVLLLAAAVPGALPVVLSVEDQRFSAVVVLFLTLPVVTLLVSTTRLSAATRDRRLAALRLLGASAGRTRLVAASEALVLSLTGVVGGLFTYAFAVRPLVQAVDQLWRSWFDGRPLAPGALGWLAVAAGVPGLSVLVALAPVRSTSAAALSVRRQAAPASPQYWRLLPLAVGVGLLAWSAGRPSMPSGDPSLAHARVFFVGVALTAVSLPLVVPVGVRLLGDAASRWGRSAPTTLAGRRLQQEPGTTTRLLAALLAALFLVAGGRCVLITFETTPQYLRAARASSTGPQIVELDTRATPSWDVASVRELPAVRAIVASSQVGAACTEDDLAGQAPSSFRPRACHDAFVGSCDELQEFAAATLMCRDEPAWLSLDPQQPDRLRGTDVVLVPQNMLDPEGEQPTLLDKGLRLGRLPVLDIPMSTADPNWVPRQRLFVPSDTPGLEPLLTAPGLWLVALQGGPAAVRSLEEALPPQVQVYPEDMTDLSTVDGYRAVLHAVTGIVLLLGLASLVVHSVDQAVERRRHLAALTLLGVPSRVVRRSQLLQVGAPLLVGFPIAGALGLLSGVAYLNLIGMRAITPLTSVVILILGALCASAVVVLASIVGLGGRVRAQDLRQE